MLVSPRRLLVTTRRERGSWYGPHRALTHERSLFCKTKLIPPCAQANREAGQASHHHIRQHIAAALYTLLQQATEGRRDSWVPLPRRVHHGPPGGKHIGLHEATAARVAGGSAGKDVQ